MKGVNFIHMRNIEAGMYSDTKIQDNRNCAKGEWVTARPSGHTGLRMRIAAAWLVFTGKADVIYFDADQ
jgi:hypothetical protein